MLTKPHMCKLTYIRRLSVFLLFSFLFWGCQSTQKVTDKQLINADLANALFANHMRQDVEPSKAIKVASKIPENASVKELQTGFNLLLDAIGASPRQDLGIVYHAISLLRSQPNLAKAVENYYQSLKEEDFSRKLFTLKVIGEFRQESNLAFLKSVIWSPLPKIEPVKKNNANNQPYVAFSPRDYKMMLMTKAVQGAAYYTR